MPYPSEETMASDIVRDVMENGELTDFENLHADVAKLFQQTRSIIRIYKEAFDQDGNVRTQQPTRELDIITEQTLDGDGINDTFTLVTPIDTATELIGWVYVDDVRMFTPADYTYDGEEITFTITPGAGTANIRYSVVQNTAGVIDRLEAVTQGLGAYLIGFPNDDGLYQAQNAGDALDEVRALLDDLIADLGVLGTIVRSTGDVPLTADWLVNLRKATGSAVRPTGIIEVTGVTNHLDTFTVPDGVRGLSYVFAFTSAIINASTTLNLSGVPDVASTWEFEDAAGESQVFEFYANGGSYSGTNWGVENGVDAASTALSLVNAVNAHPTLSITAVDDGGGDFTLTQDLPGTAGNTVVVESDPGGVMTGPNFTGGLDEVPTNQLPVVIGADANETADNIADAINASGISITALWASGTAVTNLTHMLYSTVGNRTITQSGTGLTLTGMAGGINGTLGDLQSFFRFRNLPPSLEDGDVVVHEQLQGLLNSVDSLGALFLRLDGTSIMAGNVNVGGYKVTNLADGTEDSDAVNKSQLDDAVTDNFIPITGTEVDKPVTGDVDFASDETASRSDDPVPPTVEGIPAAVNPTEVVPLHQVQSLVAVGLTNERTPGFLATEYVDGDGAYFESGYSLLTSITATKRRLTVPAWLDGATALIELHGGGGGGGGGGSSSDDGGGGGAGAYRRFLLTLTEGEIYDFDTGPGGNGGASGVTGSVGSDTSCTRISDDPDTVLAVAGGGQGGGHGGITTNGGLGGSISAGDLTDDIASWEGFDGASQGATGYPGRGGSSPVWPINVRPLLLASGPRIYRRTQVPYGTAITSPTVFSPHGESLTDYSGVPDGYGDGGAGGLGTTTTSARQAANGYPGYYRITVAKGP